MAEGEKRALAIWAIACLTAVVGVSIFLDWLGGAMTMPWFFAGGLLAAGVVGSCGWWLSRSRMVAAATMGAVLALIALRFVALSPVKPFREFFGQLEPGMSESEVLGALARNFPADGRYAVPTVYSAPEHERISFILDRTDGRYNAEGVSVSFEDGKLKIAQYSPD